MLIPPTTVRHLRQRYEVIRATNPGTAAPIEEQHRFWRAHDAAKRDYAIADWQWESRVLQTFIAAVIVLGVLSFFAIELISVAIVVTGLALWRCYVIFTRHAPD